MNYTRSQQAAIDARGEDLLISAAAGSGKTRVLVDRIVAMMVRDQVPLAEMLIVTFTNAAAGEMKARLRQGLQATVQAAEGQARDFLLAQLEALPEAHISTMHAFCISELRRFYHVLGLDPAFRILTEATTTILREDALEEAMDAAYVEGDEGFLQLVQAYGGRSGDTALRELVRSLYSRIQAHAEPLAWLDTEAARFEGPLPEAYVTFMRTLVEETAQAMRQGLEEARRLADLLPNAEKCHAMLDEDASIVQGLVKCSTREDLVDALMAYLPNVKWVRKPSKPRNATVDEAELDAALAALRNGYKEQFEALKGLSIEGGSARVAADRALMAPFLRALAVLVRRYDAAYRAAKKAREGLDFNDLEHEMLRLLADEGALAAIREEIQYIFFDEYQDANPIQEAIVEKLAHPGRLFFVGDVKQAIYRFRRADPNIFNRRYARYRDTDAGRLIFLAENFRSRGEILGFANALFRSLMTPSLGDVDYQEPGQALVCGGDFTPDASAVQCLAVVSDERGQEDREAVWIAEEIMRLVASGRYDYGDIVVLMRSPRARLHAFEEVFKDRHIPYYSDNSVVGFENLEVRLFIAMLTVLANDELDEALLSALLSPFGGLTDEEIARVRLEAPETAFARACKAYLAAHEDALAAKLAQFYETLARHRHALHYDPLADVALRLFEESGYSAFLLGMEDGVERQQNVMAFIELMAEYEKGHRYGLAGFLHYVDTLKARSMDSTLPGIGLSESDHCVRIMSIHKSKGLGFKVVFLADMSHGFNLSDSRQTLVIDDQLGLAMKVVDLARGTTHAPLEKNLIALKSRRETLSEEVRLLYVALTRAIDRLYLVASFKAAQLEKWQERRGSMHADGNTFRSGSSYRDWLGICLCDPAHPLSLDAQVPLYEWQIVGEEAAKASEEAQAPGYPALLAAAAPALVETIGRRFHIDYRYADATTMPYKKTVSQLTKSNQVVPDYVKQWPAYGEAVETVRGEVPVPAFIQEHLSFTGAAMGTLMHQVVQWLPLVVQDRAAIEKGLARLEAEAFLTPEERAAVDVGMLEAFYNSDFLARIVEKGRNIEHEVSFTMRQEGLMIDGQIDLFFETDEGYEIVDFKTDRQMRAERYRAQLAMYAEALSTARGKPVVHKWLYWLRHQKAEEI